MAQEMQTSSLFVALVGKPNVGKSSLMNALVGERIAIVTQKPQTTRTKITGILTREETQFVFLDTPGIHAPRTKLGERMVKAVTDTVADVDLAVMLFEPYGEPGDAEMDLIADIAAKNLPAIAVVNKIDTLKSPEDLQERFAFLEDLGVFRAAYGISAREHEGIEDLLDIMGSYAQPGPHFFPDDSLTDMPEKAIVAEIIREKLLLNLRDEIPHGTAVVIESFKEREDKNIIDIEAEIFCEKKSHKGMIIGKGGAMLKKVATEARLEIEDFLGVKVNLQCWVKVKDDWRDSDFLLNNFGFEK